jgi:hypothetical protein
LKSSLRGISARKYVCKLLITRSTNTHNSPKLLCWFPFRQTQDLSTTTSRFAPPCTARGCRPDDPKSPLLMALYRVQPLIEPHTREHQQKYPGPDAEHAHWDAKPVELGRQFSTSCMCELASSRNNWSSLCMVSVLL